MEKRIIEPDRWFEVDGCERVILMHWVVDIKKEDYIVKLFVYYDSKTVLTLDFLSVDQAKHFTEDIINNVFTVKDICREYEKIVIDYNWVREMNYINDKAEEITTFSTEAVKLYKYIKEEYESSMRMLPSIMNDTSKTIEQKNNYYLYAMNLKEKYNKLKAAVEGLLTGLEDTEGIKEDKVCKDGKPKERKRKVSKKTQ